MAKSDHEVEDDAKLKLSVPFSSMYLFGSDEKRIALDEEAKALIKKAFA